MQRRGAQTHVRSRWSDLQGEMVRHGLCPQVRVCRVVAWAQPGAQTGEVHAALTHWVSVKDALTHWKCCKLQTKLLFFVKKKCT